MDPGTDARDVLQGQAVRLKNGWIGIVNRGQADIMGKASFCPLVLYADRRNTVVPCRLLRTGSQDLTKKVGNADRSWNVQMPMAEARKKELEFFKGSKHYSDLKNVGTGFLSSKLSTHLINAIRKQLPIIQHSINDGIVGLDRELQSLGGPAVTTRGQMVHLILQVCLPSLLALLQKHITSSLFSLHLRRCKESNELMCFCVVHFRGSMWTGCRFSGRVQ